MGLLHCVGKTKFVLLAAAAVAVLTVQSMPAAAAGCAEGVVKATASGIAGMTVVDVTSAEAGVVVSLQKAGQKGMVIVGLCLSGEDFVTYQGSYGRPGGSDLTADESAWLMKFFGALVKDPGLKSCAEFKRMPKPSQSALLAAMGDYWKAYSKFQIESGEFPLLIVLVAAVALLLVVAVVVVVLVKRARRRRAAGSVAGGVAVCADKEPESVEVLTEPESVVIELPESGTRPLPGPEADEQSEVL